MKARSTVLGGGLEQITTCSHKSNGLVFAAKLPIRWVTGDFHRALGELVAMCKLIALWKDDKKTDVRPVRIARALRRLLTRAYTGQVRVGIAEEDSQWTPTWSS